MPLNTIPNKGLTSRGYPSDRLVTPIIINGDMSVAQRGTSGTGFGPSKTGYQLDRFAFRKVGGDSAVFTISQDTDVPSGQGFANSMKIDCTTALADGSIPSSQWVRIRYRIEGQDLQLIKKGTSSAETLTMCFWVKSPKTGTHIVSIYDDDNTRLIAKSYTVSSANTWEKKTIAFEGDTTGTLTNDNSSAFRIEWHLQSGADYQSGSLGTTWHAFDSTKTSVGQVNIGDSTANNFFLTGVQLEVGEFDSTTIPSFPFESYESNLRRCERYFENQTANGSCQIAHAFGGSSARCYFQYRTKKRTAPTITLATAGNGDGEISFLTKGGAYVGTIGTHQPLNVAIDRFNIDDAGGYGSTGWSEGDAIFFYVNGNNYVIWEADAEL